MKSLVTLFILLTVLTVSAQAQSISFSGQIRERSELDTKNLTIRANTDVFHLLRTRLRADAAVNEYVSAVVEVQDARVYGDKKSTLNSGSPAFDLRQGYVEVREFICPRLTVRLGRQVLAYGNERLLGPIDWNNFSQSFDAALVRIKESDLSLDLFGAAVARNPYTLNGLGYDRDVYLLGAWGTWKPTNTNSALHVFYLYDNPSSTMGMMGATRQYRNTAGLQTSSVYGNLDVDLDFAYQFGEFARSATITSDISISASMLGTRIGYTFPDLAKLRIGVGIDLLSGNDPKKADTYGAFNTLYGTNHKYYGYMDYFTDLPAHTSTMGLQDLMVQLSCVPMENVKLAVDGHLFSVVTDPNDFEYRDANNNIITTDYPKTLGMEVDLTLWVKVQKAVNVMGGVSVFDWDKERAIRTGRKTTNWAYLMTTVNF